MISDQNLRGLKIGVLGGGITGLTSAFYLLRAGADVTLLESQRDIGGLSSSYDGHQPKLASSRMVPCTP